MRRYAVLGTGAVGGFYGSLLARAGHEVHFLLHSDLDHVRANGLRCDSPLGDMHLRDVQAHGSVDTLPDCDVVLVSFKTTSRDTVRALLPGAVRPGATVVLLQNGLGIEDDVADVLPDDVTLLGGLCFLCSNKVGPGHIVHLDYGAVVLGEHGGDGSSALVRGVADDFVACGAGASIDDDLVRARWRKLVWNVPFNGLSVVLDATTDQMLAVPEVVTQAKALMDEVVAGAAACGRVIPPEFTGQMLDQTANMIPYKTSMKLDAEAGRPLEVDAIVTRPLLAARAAGLELPKLAMLEAQLRYLSA